MWLAAGQEQQVACGRWGVTGQDACRRRIAARFILWRARTWPRDEGDVLNVLPESALRPSSGLTAIGHGFSMFFRWTPLGAGFFYDKNNREKGLPYP